jgi:hypothetical protein
MRGPIGWADAITAACVLGLSSPAELESLVDMLGLTVAAGQGEQIWESPRRHSPAPEPAGPPAERLTSPLPRGAEVGAIPRDRRTDVTELDAQPLSVDLEPTEPLDSPPAVMPSIPYQPPVPEPMLRASLLALLRRHRRSDDLDLAEIISRVAEQRPLTDLPRLDETTTQWGVTVIADAGRSMLPYLADLECFTAEIEHVVGSPNADIRWVDDHTAHPGSLGTPRASLTPGRSVLVISTLGAVQAPSSHPQVRLRWLDFADHAARVGADVIALVPHRLTSWPRQITDAITRVVWEDLPLVGRGHG